MADPAKANSNQTPRRKKTVSRGKKGGARTNKSSARRKQSKSSQIDLFDDEITISNREETKQSPPKPVTGAPTARAKPATDEIAVPKQASKSYEKVVPQPKPPTASEPPLDTPKVLPKEVTKSASPEDLPRFPVSAIEAGPGPGPAPRRLLRSQQQRAAKLRMIAYIGGGVLILVIIAFAVFLLVRGRTTTNIKGVTESATSENSPPATTAADEAPSLSSEEPSDAALPTSQAGESPISGEQQELETAGESTGISDSQEYIEESATDVAIAEAESTPLSTTAATPELLPEKQAVSPSDVEVSDSTEAIVEKAPSTAASSEAASPPTTETVTVSSPSPAELAMAEKTEPTLPVARAELVQEEGGTVPSTPQSSSEQTFAVDFSSPWTNSLGMKFVPVDNVLFSVWETRVKDFEAFTEATGRERKSAPYEESGDYPVSRMNWNDTQEFCTWLTEKERSDGIIGSNQHYRLPTDHEWSLAAGLEDEIGDTPEARDGQNSKAYPWGSQWPPPDGTGNIADRSASSQLKSTVDSYEDGYVRSAPVGRFEANSHGIYDLSGNLWEWCQDAYGGKGSLRNWHVMRGGSWSTSRRKQLLSSYRSVVEPDSRGLTYGFRCVLVQE